MRIDSLNQVSQLYQSNSTKMLKTEHSKNFKDSLEISRMGKNYQAAKQAVLAAPDVREDKIAEIREAMASGSYHVKMEDLADKLIESYDSEFM